MAESVALDISDHAVHAVQLEGSGRNIRLLGCWSVPIQRGGSTEQDALIREAIEELFSENKLNRDQVVVSLPTRKCLLRQIWLPFTKSDQIAKTLPYEIETQLQSCNLSSMVISYTKIRETSSRSEILVVAAPRDEVEGYLNILDACKIDPIAIDLDIAALYNTVRRSSIGSGENALAVVDIQPNALRIVILDNGDLRLGRSIPISPSDNPEEDDPAPFYDAVTREIRLSLASKNFHVAEENLYLTGDVGGGTQAAGEIAHRLGMAPNTYDFVQELTEGKQCAPQAAVALGSGYKGLGRDLLKIDFRKGDFIYKTGYEVIKRPLAVVASLCLIISFVVAMFARSGINVEEKAKQAILARKEAIWSLSVLPPSKFKEYSTRIGIPLQQARDRALGTSNAAEFTPPLACTRLLKQVGDAILELHDPEVYVRNVAYRWDKEKVELQISGSFHRPPSQSTPWLKLKELLSTHTTLRVVEENSREKLGSGAKNKKVVDFEITLTNQPLETAR